MRDEPPARPTGIERARWLLGVGFGLGHAPLAPGTFGSLLGLGLGWPLMLLGGWPALLAGVVLMVAAGTWAAEGVARRLGRRDPGEAVVDEIAGQMLALLLIPPTFVAVGLCFLFFRFFDIVKPFPARRLEALPGGLGIMVDDLVAGIYANLAVQALAALLPDLVGVR